MLGNQVNSPFARLCLIVGMILLILGIRLSAEDWSRTFKKVSKENLVLIDVHYKGLEHRGSCSGIVVAHNQVLTAAHCLNPDVEGSPEKTGYVNGKKVYVLKTGPADLTLIDADTRGKRSIVIPFIGPPPGTPVAAIGHAGGHPNASISSMMIMQTEDGTVYTNNTVFKGFSGGPLVSLDGSLAGVMVGTELEWGFSISVDIATIRTFLETPASAPVPPAETPARPLLEPSE